MRASILPCFRTTTYLNLCQNGVDLALPPPGSRFEAHTTLALDARTISFDDLIPMCPSQRYLDVNNFWSFKLIVHSPSLEKLDVNSADTITAFGILELEVGVGVV